MFETFIMLFLEWERWGGGDDYILCTRQNKIFSYFENALKDKSKWKE